MSSAGDSGYSRYRGRRLGIKTAKFGRDGGGKIMKRRAVKFSVMRGDKEFDVPGPVGKKHEGWAS